MWRSFVDQAATVLIPGLVIALTFSAVSVTTACSRTTDSEVAELHVNGHRFSVEIAADNETRAQGLMFRERLEPRHGMLFVFEDDQRRSFWMRDTSIPLSIAYIRRDGTITEIYDMQPYSLEPVTSVAEVRYALEVNQGEFRELGIRAGDRVVLPEGIR